MITIYEAATGNAILTFHPRTPAEQAVLWFDASRMCERINQDLGCGAVALRKGLEL